MIFIFMLMLIFKEVGQFETESGKKMPTARCAELIAASIAHNHEEVWLVRQPCALV